ncbi:MAG: extensin family protein [Devosia sp.]
MAASDAVPLPRERPAAMEASSEPPASSSSQASSSSEPGSDASSEASGAPSSSEPPPPPPPPRDYEVACPAVMNGEVRGKALPPIHDGQCGIQSPLAIEAISANGRSIPLNAPVITDCGMATAFPAWIAEVDSYLKAHDKTQIKTINLSTSYQCRNVNHSKTGNLSFHAFADALDVMGFTLEDGRTISIAPGYKGTPEQGSQILHFAHDSACTHFMTVLGPDADAEHQDNMHLDLACHGKTCTSRLCQ